MSDLFRQSISGSGGESAQNARPRPPPIPIDFSSQNPDDSSSDSSASSAASVATVRPSSREQQAPPTHWTQYFDQELYFDHKTESQIAKYHVYLTPPTDAKKGPLFICVHGAGSAALSFATFAQEVRSRCPSAGVLATESRAHGSIVTNPTTGKEVVDFSLETLTTDVVNMIGLTASSQSWSPLPPFVLVGHSLGAAITTNIAAKHWKTFGPSLIGHCSIDVVEGSAIEALGFMNSYLSSRPSIFSSIDEAVAWHIRSRTLRNQRSAEASVPALLAPSPTGNGKLVWKTNLHQTITWWQDWYTGMSARFLAGKCAKMLVLAGTDRLDKELMIGQMQGKFQLVVIPEAGHFVQEDVPEKTADLLIEFFKRNDRSQLVLPPKVSDLLAQGKKV